MPYRISRHSDDLVWIVMHGQLTLAHADAYFGELWELLDTCPPATDLLVDGRQIGDASPSARRRTEQVAQHPHLGKIAFVVREQHLLIFAPFVKLVSGIGLFGDEHEALAFLRTPRHAQPTPRAEPASRPLPPPPASRQVASRKQR